MKNVVVIIPTYNESLVIEKTIHEVFKALSTADVMTYILVFDSCSSDNTQEIVTKMQATYPKLYLQTESQKTGLGSAYLQAMNYALKMLQAEIVIEFDADMSHQPRYLPYIVEKMSVHDVVMGSRYVTGGSIPKKWCWYRKFLSIFGNHIARLVLTSKYKDFTSGFRATRSSILSKVLPKQFISKNYAYKLELLWLLHKAKAKIIEYPIDFIDRKQGQSKLPANSISDSLRVLVTLRLRELKSYFNMCVVGLIGLMIQCIVYNLVRLKLTPSFSIQIAVSFAILNNFILNNHITFKKRTLSNLFKSTTFFIIYSILMIGLQSYWVKLGINYLGTGYLRENTVVVSGVFIGSLFNYLFYSSIIWRVKKPTGTIKEL